MVFQQTVVFGVLLVALVLFVWGRWRYDVVALLALLAVSVTGVIPGEDAFVGFGHPAVITVAAVLVVSRGLLNAGLVDLIVQGLSRFSNGAVTREVGILTGVVAFLSAFMNNVGALALMMPVSIRMARKNGRAPSLFLMPLAFASLLGGLVTLIGTPPNIIVATFRARNGSAAFQMFDFTPVGLGVTVVGLLFIILIGWRLVPQRKGQASREEMFQIENYITEVRVTENSQLVGRTLRDFHSSDETEVIVVGLVRGNLHIPSPAIYEQFQVGDILIIEANSEDLKTLVDSFNLELVGSKELADGVLQSNDVSIMECVVRSSSLMVGQTVLSLDLRWQYGINLLAVSRQGTRVETRLIDINFREGDVLLLQGATGTLAKTLTRLGCLPLAGRGLELGKPRRLYLSLFIFGAALLTAAFGIFPVQIAFTLAVIAMLLTRIISLSEAYESIDWPIIVLLGAMLPVGQALEVSGGAELIAQQALNLSAWLSPPMTMGLLLLVTMLLSNLVNNAAAAVLMSPIAVTIANGLGASIDPFLMSVAIGSSCAFLTPIGHQSNTLVMGPGGYHFGDYWRMGLLLQTVILIVALPLIMWIFPLY